MRGIYRRCCGVLGLYWIALALLVAVTAAGVGLGACGDRT